MTYDGLVRRRKRDYVRLEAQFTRRRAPWVDEILKIRDAAEIAPLAVDTGRGANERLVTGQGGCEGGTATSAR